MSEIRVLSVKQPWATLIVRGIKRFEARSWPPRWRGRIAVHASGSPIRKTQWLELVSDADVRDTLARAGLRDYSDVQNLPRTAIVGAASVVEVRLVQDWPIEELSEVDAALSSAWGPDILWRLEEPTEFRPIRDVQGKLNLWKLSGDASTAVRSQDRADAEWSGAEHLDAEVVGAREEELAELEYGREYVGMAVTLPTELVPLLGPAAEVRVVDAFALMLQEVLAGEPLEFAPPWDQSVSVTGAIGQALMPGERQAKLHEVSEALARRLTPDREVPMHLMPFLTVMMVGEE